MEPDMDSFDESLKRVAIGSKSDGQDEIQVSLMRNGNVISSFKFQELDKMSGPLSFSFIFTLAAVMQWSKEKLRDALVFYREIHRLLRENVQIRINYSVEHVLTDKVKYGELDDVRLILDVFKDDINTEIPFYCGETILGHAMTLAMPENIDIVTSLVDMGADVNHCNLLGYEILDTAIQHCQIDCVQLLVARGAKGHRCDSRRDLDGSPGPHRPLVVCSMLNNVKLAEVLISAGASMDARRYDPLFTPMRAALMKRSFGMSELLVKCGYNLSLEGFIFPTTKEALAWTPLILLEEESRYLCMLLEVSRTPITLKQQVRTFLWRYLNKIGVPIQRVTELEMPSSFVMYLMHPSVGP